MTDAGTKIENTLAWANAGLTEESFGQKDKKRSLPNQELVLGVSDAESIL